MATQLSALFSSEGQRVEAPSGRPAVLSDPATVFRVEDAPVDLFVVPMTGGEAIGTRSFVARLPPGALAFSVPDADGHDERLVLISAPDGGTLSSLPLARVQSKGDPAELARSVDAWVSSLQGALAREKPRGAPPPAAELEMRRTAELVAGDPSFLALQEFQRAFLTCVGDERRRAADEETERVRRRTRSFRTAFLGVSARIVRLLEPGYVDAVAPDAAIGGPLFAACKLVGKAAGIAVLTPPEGPASGADPLRVIARASRMRYRRVSLNEGWWRADNGPLLGYLGDDARPVALLPVGTKAYDLVDPEDGVRKRVDRETAALLKPSAHMLYRPLPAVAIDLLGLIRFGSRGLARDQRSVVLASVAVGALAVVPAIATGFLFDKLIPRGERTQLFGIIAVVLVGALASGLLQIARGIATLRIEGKLDAALQAAVWDRLLSLPMSFHRRYNTGDLAVRALAVNAIRQVMTGATTASILGGVFAVFSLVVLFVYSASLALWAILLVAVSTVVGVGLGWAQLGFQRASWALHRKVNGRVLQLFTGISKLRVAGAEPAAFSLWAKDFVQQKRLDLAAKTRTNALATFNTVLPAAGALLIYWRIGETMATDPMPAGIVIAFLSAFGSFVGSMTGLTSGVMSLLVAIPLYESARPILQTLPESDEAKASPGELTGEVEVNGVEFRYEPDTPLVLRGISFRVEKGEFAALVGASGAGKSTLLKLFLGLDRPESGTILYDGQDLAGLDVLAVRQQIGTVLQTGKLVPGDVLTNIVGGASSCTIEDAWEAARMVGMDADIDRMPMGMSTFVSEGMGTFSGGQRQRLLIARALVNRPRILLMDEATSALDDTTQAIVSASLERLKVTRIVIAHRLSTIRSADRIHFVKDGVVTEVGSYEELMARKADFYGLAARQIV